MNITTNDDGTILLSDFNGLQAYKIARKLEKDGMAFYSKVLDALADQKINSAIQYLLASEKDHFLFFEARIEALQAEEVDGFEDEDVIDFIESGIFSSDDIAERDSIDFTKPASVVSYGIIVEAKSIAFYTALLENTTDSAAQSALKDIIAEEQKHLETLREFV